MNVCLCSPLSLSVCISCIFTLSHITSSFSFLLPLSLCLSWNVCMCVCVVKMLHPWTEMCKTQFAIEIKCMFSPILPFSTLMLVHLFKHFRIRNDFIVVVVILWSVRLVPIPNPNKLVLHKWCSHHRYFISLALILMIVPSIHKSNKRIRTKTKFIGLYGWPSLTSVLCMAHWCYYNNNNNRCIAVWCSSVLLLLSKSIKCLFIYVERRPN